jgi:cytochrome c556
VAGNLAANDIFTSAKDLENILHGDAPYDAAELDACVRHTTAQVVALRDSLARQQARVVPQEASDNSGGHDAPGLDEALESLCHTIDIDLAAAQALLVEISAMAHSQAALALVEELDAALSNFDIDGVKRAIAEFSGRPQSAGKG